MSQPVTYCIRPSIHGDRASIHIEIQTSGSCDDLQSAASAAINGAKKVLEMLRDLAGHDKVAE